MNLILCDDDKAFLDKLEIRIRGLCQKHKIAVLRICEGDAGRNQKS